MTFESSKFALLHVFAFCLFAVGVSETVEAQRGRRGGGSQFNVASILKQIDANKNGVLEPSEMAGRTKEFVRRAGLDPNRAHAIATITNKLENKKTDNNTEGSSNASVERKVPGFGVDRDPPDIRDFSPTGEERMSVEAMNKRFGQSIMNNVDRTMTRYDKDKNGLIDGTEQKRTRWDNPSLEESDKNNDGNLSRLELAYRYKEREDKALNRGRSTSSSTASLETRGVRRSNSTQSSRATTSSRSSRSSRATATSTARGTTSSRSRGRSDSRRSSSYRGRSRGDTASSSKSAGFSKGSDAYRRYAEGLIKNYDKNGDKKLSKEEMSEMRRPVKDADTNKDGFVDQNELVASVTKKSGKDGAGSDDSKSVKKSSSRSKVLDSKRRSARKSYNSSDNVFGGKDANGDGQLQMVEFADEWDDGKVDDFKAKDRNDDGVITEKEWHGI